MKSHIHSLTHARTKHNVHNQIIIQFMLFMINFFAERPSTPNQMEKNIEMKMSSIKNRVP